MRKIAALMVLFMAAAASANLLVNGDWSTGDETGWTQWRAAWGSGETWAVTAAGPTQPEGTADSTTDSASFGWYQAITNPGAGPYTLSADWSGDVGGGGWAEVMFFTVPTGTDPAPVADAGAAGDIAAKKDSWGLNTPPNNWGWESAALSPATGSFNLTAAAGEDVVVALKAGNTAVVSWDNLVVVPEPATMLLGISGLALVARRRRR